MKLKSSVLLCLCFLLIHVFAQKKPDKHNDGAKHYQTKTCRSLFKTIPLDVTDNLEESVKNYLIENIGNIADNNNSLQLIYQVESPGGIHLTFQQLYNLIPIYNAQIKINLDKHNNIKSIFDNSVKTNTWQIELPVLKEADNNRELIVSNYMSKNFINVYYKHERIIFFDESTGSPYYAYKIRLYEPGNRYDHEIILDENNNVLQEKDMNVYLLPQDSTVNAMIFLPDPLTTAGVVYGSPYIDSGDIDITELNAERVSDTMTATFNNDTFYLENQYVIVVDLAPPTVAPAISITPNFNYTRAQSGFEDVNAFYHINKFQNYMQSIGFSLADEFQIKIDPHGGVSDNSVYSSFPTPSIRYGDGGVDDAEDADVIIHEYGHAVSYSAVPGTNTGFERQSLDEGLGDYLAVSYSKSINPFNWGNVFSWDGHNEFWPGRSAASNKYYPDDLGGDIHLAGEIWSSVLMEIWDLLGRQTTDQLVLQSIYGWATGMSMMDAAQLLLQADTVLFGGANYNILCDRLEARGLIDGLCFVKNEYAKSIAAGDAHSIVICKDNSVEAWGRNNQGQLGDGTIIDKLSSVQMMGLADIVAVAGGDAFSLALRDDSTVWATGANFGGQLGNGQWINSMVPVQALNITGVVNIAAGGSHSVALCNDSTVWTWGYNGDGQLGDSTTIDKNIAQQVPGLTNIVAMAAGASHSLALRDDGTIWAWGENDWAQLGNDTLNPYTPFPIQVSSLSNVIAIDGGYYHSMALTADSLVWTWGNNSYAQLGDSSIPLLSLVPIQAQGISNVVKIASGGNHSLALKDDSTLWTWGDNIFGQLGTGSLSIIEHNPKQAQGITGIVEIDADNHCLALTKDEKLWTWGMNYYGQLGTGDSTHMNIPLRPQISCIDLGVIYLENEKLNVLIYPNPIQDKITIELTSIAGQHRSIDEVIIYSIHGKELSRTSVNSNKITLDFPVHASGIYLLKVNVEGHTITRKLLKTR